MRGLIDHKGYVAACADTGPSLPVAEEIIVRALAGLHAPEQTAPVLTHMMGIPGAGKTTVARALPRDNTLLLGFDDVMESLPDYAADVAALGPRPAFERWEVCAREIGYEILFRGIERGLNIIFDNSGTRQDHVDLLRHIRAARGYRVRVIACLTDMNTARARAAVRPRHVPDAYFTERQARIAAMLPLFAAVADSFETVAPALPAAA